MAELLHTIRSQCEEDSRSDCYGMDQKYLFWNSNRFLEKYAILKGFVNLERRDEGRLKEYAKQMGMGLEGRVDLRDGLKIERMSNRGARDK